MKSIFFFYLILSTISFPPLQAQSFIPFNHLTVADGLSQSSVTCIFQDRKGFMWFGTQDGLNKFDGYRFKVFKNDPVDTTSLSENFIFSIYEDPSGSFYIETQSRVLHLYDPATESFLRIHPDRIDLSKTRFSTVGALHYDSDGTKWSGGLSKGTGLIRTDPQTGETKIYKNDPDDPASLSDDRVYSILRDRSGDLWVGTSQGLDQFDEQTGRFIHYRSDPDDPASMPDNWVWTVYEDSHHQLWIGTANGGLARFNRQTGHFIRYQNDPNDPTSISSNFIFSIFEDSSSMLWIGTNLAGINYFHPSTTRFGHYKNDPGNPNTLSDNLVATILADRNGIYWIGTTNGGLNRFDYSKNLFTHYMHNPSNPNSLTSNSLQSLLEDNNGILWIGTYGNGLNAFDRKRGKFRHYMHDPQNPNSISDNRIYALAEDKTGKIWIGTYGGGLNCLDPGTDRITRYQNDADDPASISSNSTWALEMDDSGTLWIGTFGGGINVFDAEKKTFLCYRNDPADSMSIQDDNIIRVFNDSRDNMWFGMTKGLSRLNRESGTFRNYNVEDGLPNSFVYGIVEDDHGNLWLSTNDGLAKFDPQTETFRNYYDKDGLQGNEFNQNAFAKDTRTGNLLFGGPNGFNVFHPDSLQENLLPPPVEFTGYIRYNTDDEEGKPIVEKGITERDRISLTYKDNIITLEFAALSYFNNTENRYRYKLEGFNENWIQLGNNHSVTFTNLSADEYKLRVIGSNNDGVWNNEGATLDILVSPPWWKTNIAYALYFVAFFGLLFGIRQVEINRREQKAQIRESALRIKATEAEKRALEIENERKTRELEEARQLQLSMLPRELPQLPNLEIAAFMRTATEVGGDYYDFIVGDHGELNVAFGDATGHGLQAGTMVTLMKGFFTSDSPKLGLQDFMNHCTRVIKEIKLGRILMSFSYLRIADKKLQLTSAGMPPVYYYNKQNDQLQEILLQGPPLGAMRNAKYQISEIELNSGDTILLLSDGLPEQMNPQNQMFDYEQTKTYFTRHVTDSPETIIQKLVAAGDQWMGSRSQDDDITFVVIRVK